LLQDVCEWTAGALLAALLEFLVRKRRLALLIGRGSGARHRMEVAKHSAGLVTHLGNMFEVLEPGKCGCVDD
jgi:hypothetical protein